MKIYTKTGDSGQTSLLGGTRVAKYNLRIESYGSIDELNSYIGLLCDQEIEKEKKEMLYSIQDRLFTIGANLAADPNKSKMKLPENAAIRVLLADDHPIVMTGFAMSLESEGMHVLGQARTPQEALAQFGALQPDVLILDIRFGAELTGLDAARQVLQKYPGANIVFLSQFDQDALIKETYRLGARAFVTKDCNPADLATLCRPCRFRSHPVADPGGVGRRHRTTLHC